ncbi:TPA: ead/Ea22-like family protein [Klebsiella aerogenes]
MTDITELAQSLKAAAEKASNGDWLKESGDGWEASCSANDQANGGFIIAHFEGPDAAENREFVQAANPANILALVEALEKAQGMEGYWKTQCRGITDHCEQLQAQIAELESRTVTVKPDDADEVREEGNQFLVVRHPGKVPVIKHPVGQLEDYLLQILKADPLATIDIVTHRYYGVGGQFVEDADEYLHEMGIKWEAE